MNSTTRIDALCSFETPAVRHLAWLCQAPQLLSSPISFRPADYLPKDYINILMAWDKHPELAPPLLFEPPQKRLGFYFERLYQVLLEELLGWDILLKNQQIHANGRTIGELDFVIHNSADNRVEHHEIAIKFYLGVPESTQHDNQTFSEETLWYGPNAIDRLDLKTNSLLNDQSQRTQAPETIALLNVAGITDAIKPKVFIPGYLFHPDSGPITTPAHVPDNHLRGIWMYASEAKSADTSGWVKLNKPHWIGPWVQATPPTQNHIEDALNLVESHKIPQLFSILESDIANGVWIESGRVFVVPASWP